MSTASTPEAVGDEKIGVKIARNTLASSIGRFWWMAVSFLLTPYIVNRLGDERVAMWAFLAALAVYFALFDSGIVRKAGRRFPIRIARSLWELSSAV